jgi:hypothetical protein
MFKRGFQEASDAQIAKLPRELRQAARISANRRLRCIILYGRVGLAFGAGIAAVNTASAVTEMMIDEERQTHGSAWPFCLPPVAILSAFKGSCYGLVWPVTLPYVAHSFYTRNHRRLSRICIPMATTCPPYHRRQIWERICDFYSSDKKS